MKRARVKREKPIPAPILDRLSALPDDVICRVLSFLPTKLSLATSVLARRWKSLWAHVPTLEFRSEDFNSNNNNIIIPQPDIIYRLMLQYKSEYMNTFRLSKIHCTSTYQLETWINIAIQRNVQNLDICLFIFPLPPRILTCKTLIHLKLSCFGLTTPIGKVSLPNLKKIHFYIAQCRVDEDLPRFLSGCPVLEDLTIDELSIQNRNLGCLNISSPTIKRFTFSFYFDGSKPDYMVNINAPVLEYFKVKDTNMPISSGTFKHISLISPMNSLIEADISFNTASIDDYYTHSATKFFTSLCNVRSLKLTGRLYSDKFLDFTGARFNNLSKLQLQLHGDWNFGIKLLEIADNLQVLTVNASVGGIDEANWMEPKQVPTCVLSRITTIKIVATKFTEHGFNMIRYFLRNAQVLQRMEINSQLVDTDLKGKFDAVQRIALYERGSKACQLVFY